MVPNQRQLFIVVSDWGSYLGSHFPLVFVGSCSMFSCLSALFILVARFVSLFSVHSFNKLEFTHTTLRLGPILTTIVTHPLP